MTYLYEAAIDKILNGTTFVAVNSATTNKLTFRTLPSEHGPFTSVCSVIGDVEYFMGTIFHESREYRPHSQAEICASEVQQRAFRWVWDKLVGYYDFPAKINLIKGR